MEHLSYYDFDANWDGFLAVWKHPDVQNAVELDISFWKELGFFKNYKSGDPLWKETKTSFWIRKCVERASAKAAQERHVALFKRTMSVVCPRMSSSRNYYKACFGSVIKECEPKQDTIEWFIMPEGPFIFRNSMLACARILCPNDTISVSMIGGRMATVINSNTVFDLFGYYFDKYDKNERYKLDI